MATRRRTVVWSVSAQQGLDDALAYVASDSLQRAQAIARKTLEAADSLALLSERGRLVPETQDPTIREIFIYSYRLLYRVGDSQVTVLAFIHGARDFERWRREEP